MKKSLKKLHVNRETVRALSPTELALVPGGKNKVKDPPPTYASAYNSCDGCDASNFTGCTASF